MGAGVRKVLLNVSVLLLTFLIGCLVQFSLRRAENSYAKPPASNKVQTPPGWKRITIGRVSFYVPPEMEPIERSRDAGAQTLSSVNGGDLYLYYVYGFRILTDVNAPPSQSQQATVSGMPAWIRKWEQPAGPWSCFYHPGMQLVIADVGDGNKFELYAVATDLTTVQRVFDTVELH